MPSIQKIVTVEILPEKYVDSCTAAELQALMLIAEARLSIIMDGAATPQAAHKKPAPKPEPNPEPEPTPTRRKRGVQWTAEDVKLLRELDVEAAAKHFNLSRSSVYAMRSRYGVSERREARARAQAAEGYDVNNNGALTGVLL